MTLMAGRFGSRQFGTKPHRREAIELTGSQKPVALYIGAASRAPTLDQMPAYQS
jgi:hypothetical protein